MQVALKDAKRGDMVIVRDTVQATGMTRLTVNFLTSVLKSKKIVKTLWGIHYDISSGKAVGQDTPPGVKSSWIPDGKILAVIRQEKVLFEGYPTPVNILRLNDSKGLSMWYRELYLQLFLFKTRTLQRNFLGMIY